MELTQLKSDSPVASGFAESRIGGRGENQDSFDWADTPWGLLVTVCDGMGGGPGGKTASTIATSEIIAGVMEADSQEKISNILIKAIRRANMAILNKGNEQPELRGMGSTCTVLLINPDFATIAHVGDSRVYQFRGRRKVFRTFDHSMVFELVKQKVITEEQARLSAQSNVITRALGIKPDLEVEVTERAYEKGDRFMLCTDGIHGAVEEKVLIQLATDPKLVLGKVVEQMATEIDNAGRAAGGGHDNLTLALVETKIKSKKEEPMSTKIKQILLALGILCVFSLVANIYLTVNAVEQSTKLSDLKQTDKVSLMQQKDSLEKVVTGLRKDTNKLHSEVDKYRNVFNTINQDPAGQKILKRLNLQKYVQ